MNTSFHGRIKTLIEETNAAYGTVNGHVDCDYAEFASLSLPEFKTALGNAELTAGELSILLRSGGASHRQTAPKDCWATFMAHYISLNANVK